MILITGASGKTGKAVVAALARSNSPVRAVVRRPSQVEMLLRIGAGDAVIADMRAPGDMQNAFEGVRAVYHICPNMSPFGFEIGAVVIASAISAGIEHLVYHSVLHPQTREMPHHWNKLQVEEALIDSGLNFTILQPAAYMQNLLAGWELLFRQGVLRNPYPVETRLSLVDLQDVSEVAVEVLTRPGHKNAIYELAGTNPLSQLELAEILADALGRPVKAEEEPLDQWDERAVQAGLDVDQRELLKKMFSYYAGHGFAGNPTTLKWLLGRRPTNVYEFAQREAKNEAGLLGGK